MREKILTIAFLLFTSIGFTQTTTGEYTVKNIEENKKNSDFGTSFYTYEKVIFSSSRGILKKKWNNGQPFLDLYEGVIEPNGELTRVKILSTRVNSKYHESNVAFSPDYKTVYFTRNNTQSKEVTKDDEVKKTYLGLYRADIASDGDWENIIALPFNSRNYSVGHPTVSRDGKKLYFTSDMPCSYGGTDIFMVDINKDGTYSTPKNLGKKINTLGKEMFPFIDNNNILYFSSDNRKGGFGGIDVYAVKIYEDSYSKVLHLGEPINTEKDDFAFIINNNTNQGYFSSNRKGGKGDDDIYHFIANPPLEIRCNHFLTGVVKDDSGKLLKGAKVSIFNENNEEIKSVLTKYNGSYKLEVPCDSKIKIVANKLSYLDDEKWLSTKNNPNVKEILNLNLNKIEVCIQTVNVTIRDVRTSKVIPYAIVDVYDKNGKNINMVTASKRGEMKFELPCNKEFKFVGNKDKYDENEMMFRTNDGRKNQKVILKLKLTPDLTEVTILNSKVVVNINPIYFSLNSAEITPTAAIELDKVVAIMRKYPKLKIEGGSHTDSRGGQEFNLKLSHKRASSTVQYIVSQGINSERITAKGYGETQLVNKCVDGVRCTEKEHQLNRRTEFVILNPDELGYY